MDGDDRRARDAERKRKQRSEETEAQRESRKARDAERKRKQRDKETDEQRAICPKFHSEVKSYNKIKQIPFDSRKLNK